MIQLPEMRMPVASDRWLTQWGLISQPLGLHLLKYLMSLFFGPQVTALVVLVLPELLLPLWLHWNTVILIPTLHVTGRACEL